MKVIALLNAKAGSVTSAALEQAQQLREAFSTQGVEADVRSMPGSRLGEAAKAAAGEGVDAVVVAGGDGTVSTAAGALVGGQVPLGILPMGTLNHFAKDLRIPQDLNQAIQLIAAKPVRQVDVAEANGRVFVNNSSIGIYPDMVRDRESQQKHLGRGKWLAMLVALVGALRRFPLVRVRIDTEDQSVPRTTPFVFIGNNKYDINLMSVGARSRLDGGQLCLYIAHGTGRFGMLSMAIRALLGRLEQARDFDTLEPDAFWVDSRRRQLLVAFDGEVTHLTPPIQYRIRPKALPVIAPPEPT